MKKFFMVLVVCLILIFSETVSFASANDESHVSEINLNSLTKSQLEVIDSFKQKIVESESKTLSSKFNNAAQSFSASSTVYGRRTSLYRGSFLAWSRDNVEWYYDMSKILSSTAWQEVGFVFPNIVRAEGIVLTYRSNTVHRYRATKTIGAGVVTPWGDVVIYNSTVTDFCGVFYNGNSSWY